jgi:hypothetical protein
MDFLLLGQVPLKYQMKPFKMHGFVKDFGGPRSDRTIDERSIEKSCEHDYRYVPRQRIGFE